MTSVKPLKPFLGAKNHDDVVDDCYCPDCKLLWRCMLYDWKIQLYKEMIEMINTPFDRINLLEENEGCPDKVKDELLDYKLQVFVIEDNLEEHFLSRFDSLKVEDKVER
jgi:hypothetical protein